MSFIDNLKRLIPSMDEDEDEREDQEEDLLTPFKREPQSTADRRRDRTDERRYTPTAHGKVVNIHATTQLKVVLVKPEKFSSAVEVADHLKARRTVVLNLESTEKETAHRLIDFLSGVAYAGEGKISKVAVNTYIITPYHVDLMGDLMDELEHNGMYF